MNGVWYTVGPSSLGRETELIGAGATGARLTFSFGTPRLQIQRARTLREAASGTRPRFTVVADLAGGKPRLDEFTHGSPRVSVVCGELYRFSVGRKLLGEREFPVRPQDIPMLLNVAPGDELVVGDRTAVFRVETINDGVVSAVAVVDGVVERCRGLTVANSSFSPASMTDSDWDHLAAIVASEAFDVVAVSFASSPDDIEAVRSAVVQSAIPMQVIAKIETQAGLENVLSLAEVADGLIAARGDLALAVPLAKLSDAVKAISHAARQAGKPWVLATQVAESAEFTPHPTAAEICDLSHWLQEGAAGVLLSRETVFGPRPIDAVRFVSGMVHDMEAERAKAG